MKNDPRHIAPLLGAALVAGCGTTTTTTLPDPPTAEELAACEGKDMGDTDFDWSCCEVWAKQCEAEGRGDECMWICNG